MAAAAVSEPELEIKLDGIKMRESKESVSKDFRAINVEGKGNCFFYALLLYLQIVHPEFLIGGKTASEMDNAIFMRFLKTMVSSDKTASDFVKRTINIEKCMAEIDTIVYLCKLLGINIKIYYVDQKKWNNFTYNDKFPTVFLLLMGVHYNSLVNTIYLDGRDDLEIKNVEDVIREYDDLVSFDIKKYLDENPMNDSDDVKVKKTRFDELVEIANALGGIENPEGMLEEDLENAIRGIVSKKYLKYKQKYLLLKNLLKN